MTSTEVFRIVQNLKYIIWSDPSEWSQYVGKVRSVPMAQVIRKMIEDRPEVVVLLPVYRSFRI